MCRRGFESDATPVKLAAEGQGSARAECHYNREAPTDMGLLVDPSRIAIGKTNLRRTWEADEG